MISQPGRQCPTRWSLVPGSLADGDLATVPQGDQGTLGMQTHSGPIRVSITQDDALEVNRPAFIGHTLSIQALGRSSTSPIGAARSTLHERTW